MQTRSGDMAAHVDASSSSTTPSPTRRTRKAVAWLLTTRIVLLAAVVAVNLWLFFHVFGSALPPLPLGDGDHGRTPIRFPPQHLDDVRRLLDFMEAHAASNGLLVLSLYCWAFLLKQAFASRWKGVA